MTRQTYTRLARLIAAHRKLRSGITLQCIDSLTKDLVYVLSSDNDRFNRNKFLEECGIESEVLNAKP